MRTLISLICAAGLIVSIAGVSVAAQYPAAKTTPSGVEYLSGGVGLDERKALEERAGEYPLKLVFALSSGQYLANVDVTILDSQGNEVLRAVSNGPWFYADLPSGSYQVSAVYKGETRTYNVSVDGGQKTVILSW